jgi:hypothetical protein
MAETTMTTHGTPAESTTRTPTFFVGVTPLAAVPGYLALWQREIDVARQLAEAWTAAVRWMGAACAAPWTGPVARNTTADRLDDDRTNQPAAAAEPTLSVTTAAVVTGEAFDEAVHLLVDNDLSPTVLQRIAP